MGEGAGGELYWSWRSWGRRDEFGGAGCPAVSRVSKVVLGVRGINTITRLCKVGVGKALENTI